MAETVRIVHPLIPGSEHDVPAESLVFKMRSGWVKWSPTPEDEPKSDAPKPEAKSEEKDSDSKPDTATTSTTSRSRTADKK